MLYVIIAFFFWWIVRDYVKYRKVEKELTKIKRECMNRSVPNAE